MGKALEVNRNKGGDSDKLLTDKVKIQHALASSWLQSIDKCAGLRVEEGVLSWWRPWARRCAKTTNIVVRSKVFALALSRRRSKRSLRHIENSILLAS